ASDLAAAGRSVLRARDMPKEIGRLRTTKGAFVSGIPYGPVDGPSVTSASDIVEWINRSVASYSGADEMGLGIETVLATHQWRESWMVCFRQTGIQFVDTDAGIDRQSVGDKIPQW